MERIILDHAPAEVVRALLIEQGVASVGVDYASWPVFVDNEPDTPDNCITIEEAPSKIDGRLHITGEVQEHHSFIIRVRGARVVTGTSPQPGYRVARNRIDLICLVLDQQVYHYSVTIEGITYIVYSANRLTGVTSIGRASVNRERYVFTVEYQFTIAQQTGT